MEKPINLSGKKCSRCDIDIDPEITQHFSEEQLCGECQFRKKHNGDLILFAIFNFYLGLLIFSTVLIISPKIDMMFSERVSMIVLGLIAIGLAGYISARIYYEDLKEYNN